jgi:hypothetical protein
MPHFRIPGGTTNPLDDATDEAVVSKCVEGFNLSTPYPRFAFSVKIKSISLDAVHDRVDSGLFEVVGHSREITVTLDSGIAHVVVEFYKSESK